MAVVDGSSAGIRKVARFGLKQLGAASVFLVGSASASAHSWASHKHPQRQAFWP